MKEYKILCIDDEDMIRQNLSDYLEDSGYKVYQACNGLDGVNKIKEIVPDTILVDLRMPVYDGFHVLEFVTSEYPDLPIIVISGTGVVQDVIEALRLGAWDYITKPIEDMVIVEHSISKCIEKYNLINENKLYKENLESIVKERTVALQLSNDQLVAEVQIRKDIEDKLKKLNEELENRVKERTLELEKSLDFLQKTKNQLVQSEKLASLGVLVSGVAHEINTPVGVAVTATSHLYDITEKITSKFNENVLKRTELSQYISTAMDSSNIILKNLKRAADQISSFKKIAVDQTSGERRKFNVKEYVNDILASLQPKLKHYSHTITVDINDDIEIDSFPGAFSQIITNLVVNSLTHAFENIEIGHILIKVEADDKLILLKYSDDGIGISEANLSKIYDPFFTTKRGQGGTGLGMNIVYNLVTGTLNGEISCKSREGEGVSFTITIPI